MVAGLLYLLGAASLSEAQIDPVPALLAQLASSAATDREAAFYELVNLGAGAIPDGSSNTYTIKPATQALLAIYPADAENVRLSLIALLSLETTSSEDGAEELTANPDAIDTVYGAYFADLATAVVALNDVRSLQALIPLLDTGNMVINQVVSFGPVALDSILTTLYKPAPEIRMGATLALVHMVSPTYASMYSDGTSMSKIRAGLSLANSTAPIPFLAAQAKSGLLEMPPSTPGDLNGDGVVNCADLAIIKAALGTKVGDSGFDIRADVNGDGVVNAKDVAAFRRLVHREPECEHESE